MPVFGADPDNEDKGWEEVPSTTNRFVSAPVRELTNYFAYHKHMQMRHRFNEDDRSRMNMFFSRKLKQGIGSDTLKRVVDKFYQTRAVESDHPSALFCTNEVQSQLMSDETIDVPDDVLMWLVEGMESDYGLFSDPDSMRKAVLTSCYEGPMRYPDVVADILRFDMPFSSTCYYLTALELAIDYNLGEDISQGDAVQVNNLSSKVALPRELNVERRAPKSLRPHHATVQQAVLAIPRKGK